MNELRLISVQLDGKSIGKGGSNLERERQIAIADLIDSNRFAPNGEEAGPFALRLAVEEERLVFDVTHQDGAPVHLFVFSLGPLRRIIKDYFLICESYDVAVREATLQQIEAFDMGRRGVHNEGCLLYTSDAADE